jgi:ribosomal protein S21
VEGNVRQHYGESGPGKRRLRWYVPRCSTVLLCAGGTYPDACLLCIGRSVPRPHGDTVANAYRKLSSIISRNNVRKELRMAERHEKKGPKRRRLSSERWRRRFAHEVCCSLLHRVAPCSFCPQVRKKVQLVQAIRTRGG